MKTILNLGFLALVRSGDARTNTDAVGCFSREKRGSTWDRRKSAGCLNCRRRLADRGHLKPLNLWIGSSLGSQLLSCALAIIASNIALQYRYRRNGFSIHGWTLSDQLDRIQCCRVPLCLRHSDQHSDHWSGIRADHGEYYQLCAGSRERERMSSGFGQIGQVGRCCRRVQLHRICVCFLPVL